MKWFKIWGDNWLLGSTRWELTAEQRAVWIDLLAKASKDNIPGQIVYYSLEQLAQQFNINLGLLESTIKRCVEKKKIKLFPKKEKILILNWKLYQSEYERQKPYRQQVRDQSKITNASHNSCNNVTLRKEGEERRIDKEEKEIKEEQEESEKREESLSPSNKFSNSPLPSISNTIAEKGTTIKEQFLPLLKSCKGYPFNEAKDSLLFDITIQEYPGININMQTEKKIAWWKNHPAALKTDPRGKLQKWFKEEYEFQKRGGPQHIGEIMKIDDPDHRNWLKQAIGTGDSQRKKES